MKISGQKFIFSSSISIVPLLTLLAANPAYSGSLTQYKIYFYDQFDNQVGQGQFTYISGNPTFISTCDNFECTGDEGFYVDNVLNSWSAEIQAENVLSGEISTFGWNAEAFPSNLNIRWWDAQASTVEGAFYGDRYGLFAGTEDAWVMRPVYINFIGFEMRGSSGKTTSSWKQYYPINLSPDSGYWVAQAVPEPLTFLGVGAAIGFGALMKRQVTKKN